MLKNNKKRMLALCALLACLLPGVALADPVPAPTAPVVSNDAVVTGYRIRNENIRMDRITRDETATLDITLKCPQIPTNTVTAADIDVSRLVDSFSGGNAILPVTIESVGTDPLSLRIVFTGCQYTGTGNSFRFMVGFKTAAGGYTQLEIPVNECAPYTETAPTARPVIAPPAPVFQIRRSNVGDPIEAGREMSLTMLFTNLGPGLAQSAVVSLSTSDSLMLQENSSTFVLGDIPPGATAQLPVRIRALRDISAQAQSVGAELKFNYFTGESIAQGTAADKLPIPAKSTAVNENAPAAAVPNIIVRKYSYGGTQVAAGRSFDLSLEFHNTSDKKKVENIVMTLETGEGLAITSSSNTFYYTALKSGDSQSETISMQALPAAKPGALQLGVSFKYEYMDNNKRSQATIAEKISIPVYQPDRFEVSAPTLPPSVNAGDEVTISLSYVNKGKSEIANVQAELIGDIETPLRLQNLGNYEPGKNGSINFIVTPAQAGRVSFTVKISYEDTAGAVQVKEVPITLEVAEVMPDPAESMVEVEETPKRPAWLWWALGGGALALGLGVAALIRSGRRKRKKKKNAVAWDDGSSGAL